MAQRPEDRTTDPKMDPATLYREEIYTDRKVGTIRTLTPVKSDGSPDAIFRNPRHERTRRFVEAVLETR